MANYTGDNALRYLLTLLKQRLEGGDSSKADKPTIIEHTLLYGQWVGESVPFLYTIPVADIKATQEIRVYAKEGLPVEEIEQFQKANIHAWSKADGQLQLAAYGDIPECDLHIYIWIGGTYKS